jgi:CheY-like chemotaxis protein
MSPDIKKSIFEPFFTTKTGGEGTGLGLSIAQGIIRNHEGEITVESVPGKGSSFHVFLPILENKGALIDKNTTVRTTGNEHILLVDDEADLVNMTRKMLERLGYVVTPCTLGIEALQILCKNPNAFDLVITDLSMGDMDGKQLIREISRRKPGIPIILCTGYSQDICREEFGNLEIAAFILKPYNKEEISKMIRKVLDAKS